MKLQPQDWRRILKLWARPLIGIPALLLLASLFEVARFLLFMHHIFWMFSAFLLLNPVIELFSPSVPREIRGRPSPRRSAKARVRVEARNSMEKPKAWPASETRAERLARLQRNQDTLDRRIEKLADKKKEKSR
jgi:hypothetical protein